MGFLGPSKIKVAMVSRYLIALNVFDSIHNTLQATRNLSKVKVG